MNIQQLITFGIVSVAALYLGWNFVVSARNFFTRKDSGCGSGCGKCGFAEKSAPFAAKPIQNQKQNLIPLSAIRTLPHREDDSASSPSHLNEKGARSR